MYRKNKKKSTQIPHQLSNCEINENHRDELDQSDAS